MVHRKAAVFVSAVFFAIASGAATGASARVQIVPWWEATVYALGPNDGYVAEWMGSSAGWTEIGGPASNLYVGSAGVFATDPSTGDIAEYSGTPGDWTVIGGPGEDFVQSDGHLYGLAPEFNYVAEWNGTPNSWTVIDGPAAGIAGGAAGLVATNSYATAVFEYNGTPNSWTQIGGDSTTFGSQFVVGDDGIYVLDDINQVEQWTGGQNWTEIGDEMNELYAGAGNVYAASNTTGDIQQYSGTPGDWTLIGGPGAQFAPSQTVLYGLAPDLSYVAQYSPGVGWTEIGGAAAAIAADG